MVTASPLTLALVRLASEGVRPPCGDPDSKLLFTSDSAEERAAAGYLCRRCPVTRECLREALETKATAGVWGGVDLEGVTPAARRRMLAQLDAHDEPDNTTQPLF